ncbi:hypothetical protein BN159_1167 [Streptomyces davaonensis JCM 4913]|uniref:Uncharacterized protein n=1 Tax=Streptomyces davaonensis (strain DSM 101723 / JCM 4913 / KCC S-0913 / 768) TaxID=1214101 RepID=K4QT02_STRDJ|nr:hypothetical protein [Streptomyces davaonensis]CCK25546.1 hypothetical protein BN159_1167 [Streptomyces davaonensis JCM 4913]
MNQEVATDTATVARHARFGKLPERVRFEDMTEVTESDPNGGANASHQDVGAWRTFSCLALDLGL